MSDISWVHIGDLHAATDDDWRSLAKLEEIVAEINEHLTDDVDFAFVPGDIANHGAPEEYARLVPILDRLRIPWKSVPGDHDFEPGHLHAYREAISPEHRVESESIEGYRCIFLDVVSSGSGGPDFRLSPHLRGKLEETLAQATALGEIPLVFMHTYPSDFSAGADEIAAIFIDAQVAIVDTGHTHYNELLNDGRTIYAATRSTGQIEEDDGRCGYSIVCVDGRVPSWRFRRFGEAWPHVQIVSPCDVRLMTRPSDETQLPRPGECIVRAKTFGRSDGTAVTVSLNGGTPVATQQRSRDAWEAAIELPAPGLHRIVVARGDAFDAIDVVSRPIREIPKRRTVIAAGNACHAIGAWPIAGIEGLQLGPNRHGRKW